MEIYTNEELFNRWKRVEKLNELLVEESDRRLGLLRMCEKYLVTIVRYDDIELKKLMVELAAELGDVT